MIFQGGVALCRTLESGPFGLNSSCKAPIFCSPTRKDLVAVHCMYCASVRLFSPTNVDFESTLVYS